MIKAILFDMDGVLIDAKEWHYVALNRALQKFGLAIDRDSHLATFDGLPTRKKLQILSRSRGLPEDLHEFLNRLKQTYTLEISAALCKPVFHHQYALSRLKKDGYKMGVCSNSVRGSVINMMQLSKLDQYLDVKMSNEDVAEPKPHPEMYVKSMEKLGVTPDETLVLEDNEHGIQAAVASGAHVMMIGTTDDVNYQRITDVIRGLNEAEGKPDKAEEKITNTEGKMRA